MAAFTTIALLALAAGSTAVSVYGQVKAGKAAKKAATTAGAAQEKGGQLQQQVSESEAGLADYNAQVAALQALDAVGRGAEEESRFRTQIRSAIAAQRVGFAAGNIDVSYGSAVDVQADAAFLGELDALTIRTNAAREAWGYNVQGEDLRRRAAIMRQEGRNLAEMGRIGAQATRVQGQTAATASYYGAASSLLGGGASLLQLRYGFKHA
jgi:hypothetical protein